ncbi:MAG TPA: hypothetical protein VH740_18735 [Vicinamibacterales bacterium]
MTRYRGRPAVTIENDRLRVTVLESGGHIAEVFDKASGVNPLWTPHWPSIDPAAYDRQQYPEYGDGVDANLLAGIMGHNLCLDIFGGPSPEEAAAGLPVHGEASTVRFEIDRSDRTIAARAMLPLADLDIERQIELVDVSNGGAVRVIESVRNLSGTDRPIGWTEHVTLGPPFLQKGSTEFRASASRSKVFEGTFGPADYLKSGAEFDWPIAPTAAGKSSDLRVSFDAPSSSAYTAHLMNQNGEDAFFVAYSPAARLAFGYVWRAADFPWMGIWEENHSRMQPPWNGATLTRGMEFGVSPFPESRREMIERARLFGTPTFRWIPAADRVSVEYWILARTAAAIPEMLSWPES